MSERSQVGAFLILEVARHANSAYPPPASNAHTLSPTLKFVTCGPHATIIPAISRPSMSAGTPAGAG
ncbi:hypothetical protein M2419_005064 [Sphingobacterium sp. BIGb0116]|nr:hypothetical protein [Sphingobacterium sp. BIGb0116]